MSMTKGVYAVCLARGGSKGVPKKNIRIVAGKPLIGWCCDAAVDSGLFEKVFVSTDSEEIKRVAQLRGYEVHNRDAATATDGASSESGIADFLKAHPECTVLCLLQATSPQTTSKDLQAAHKDFLSKGADSLVTVVRAHRFLWKVGADGTATAQNYKPEKRPLRQEWDGELMENGAFYIFSAAAFKKTNSRLSGKVIAYEMPAEAFTEVDDMNDLLTVQQQLQSKEPPAKVPRTVGAGAGAAIVKPDECQIIAEIGINHNGDIDLCKKLMMATKVSGCQWAKIQKRNPDVCVPEKQKSVMRDTPWGKMTYLDYKYRMEFNEAQLSELFAFAKTIDLQFFASVWDKDSCDVMAKFTKVSKIPSALINDLELCAYARSKFDFLIISTGMSTEEEIEACYQACHPEVVMHTNSTYPCPPEDLNMNYILHLKDKFPAAIIGYSGHEYGLVTTFGAVALGARYVERHITWDRSMWGSDQSSSVEIPGLIKLVKGIEAVVRSTAYPPGERILFEGELSKMKSLRPTPPK
jgi:N-acetylneuraminate synthase